MRKKYRSKFFKYFGWLQQVIYLWVRSKSFPENKNKIGLNSKKKVCYVIKSRSYSDLIVLDYHCKKLGLPRPLNTPHVGADLNVGSFLYLVKSGLFQQKQDKRSPVKLYQLINMVNSEKDDIQLVPVSVFWGRNPGKEEKSLFKLLFFDDENGGIIQRIFTFFIHGRNVYCNFGKPISIADQLSTTHSSSELGKKLRRVLRVHFRRQRETVLGPNIYNRNHVINSIMTSKSMQDAIHNDASKRGGSLTRSETRARKYMNEIAANVSYNTIRSFDILLSWLWKKIYDGVEVQGEQRLRELAQSHELVYLPSHRSHMDYLLLGYILYDMGLMPPHTAAGINLNFWPIGSILRRGGGFFIRRTFAGNKLYGACFSEYVNYLLTHNYPISFYPEGGRSRTGYLLDPKVGMLSMVVQSMQRPKSRPIALVPIYIGYDKLMEARSYMKELGGRAKKSESVGQLLKARKILKSEFGKVYVSFGESIDLNSYLNEHCSNWKQEKFKEGRPSREVMESIENLGEEIMARTNASAVVSPVPFFTTILMASPKQALSEDELLKTSAVFHDLLHRVPYSRDLAIFKGEIKCKLLYAEKISGINRYSHPSGDVIFLEESEKLMLSYYKNNTAHIFALPSLIASFLQFKPHMKASSLLKSVELSYELIKKDLFLKWESHQIAGVFENLLTNLVKLGLVIREGDNLYRPDILSPKFNQLRILGRIISPISERYAIFCALLNRYEGQGQLNLEHFEEESLKKLQRISILTGTQIDLFQKSAFKTFIKHIELKGFITRQGREITVEPELKQLVEHTIDLLDPDIKISLTKTDQNGAVSEVLTIKKTKQTKKIANESNQKI